MVLDPLPYPTVTYTVASLLRTSPTVIRDAVTEGNLKVAAGVYNLATGKWHCPEIPVAVRSL